MKIQLLLDLSISIIFIKKNVFRLILDREELSNFVIDNKLRNLLLFINIIMILE